MLEHAFFYAFGRLICALAWPNGKTDEDEKEVILDQINDGMLPEFKGRIPKKWKLEHDVLYACDLKNEITDDPERAFDDFLKETTSLRKPLSAVQKEAIFGLIKIVADNYCYGDKGLPVLMGGFRERL